MVDFVKYQALGNDYLLVDPAETDLPVAPAAVRLLCDRRLGVGADGVLSLPRGPVRVDRPVALHAVNADGSPCARSANGVRMLGLHLARRHPGVARVVVLTPAGESVVDVRDEAAGLVEVELGAARVDAPGELTAAGRRFDVSAVDNGNPHAVLFVDDVDAALAHAFGEAVAGHERFPDRVNAQFTEVLGPDALRVEVYERGAGHTPASGAGACAAASAAHARGLTGHRVRVEMAGGAVEVVIGDDGAVRLCGEVEQVCAGDVSPALRRRLEGIA
ncbi:diaminopimelate epimerase [Saccharothrix longispora]|uniref:diaminopimelate epimerase n=1 Tax=Saccharothrix longispora TaxID=33920 RepID=UPI0028FD18CD|nr:diaminopimelate epimerase [Saccharothrix longispora]MBY8850529.1 diaminopimelate epimerase [Saccharothrix sp. MB29]MDU0294003.1 diaminopimelate epimerase [Saccharothrix longispora]